MGGKAEFLLVEEQLAGLTSFVGSLLFAAVQMQVAWMRYRVGCGARP